MAFSQRFLCYIYMSQLMHVSDWLPTLYSAAGGNATQLDSTLNGVDQWSSLVNDEESPRQQLLVNINEREQTAALRLGDWKLVLGGCPLTHILCLI
jgi:arylsulfatase A-like enzyme